MNKKPISFGKISLNVNKAPEFEKSSVDEPAETCTSGFGTFGTFGRTPIKEQQIIEEITEDLESQHVQEVMGIRNFGKKAKNFNIDELMEQARKTAREAQKKKSRAEDEAATSDSDKNITAMKLKGPLIPLIKPSTCTTSQENDELIGPPLPPELANNDDDDLIGPPIPKQLLNDDEKTKTSKDNDGDDSYDDLSGSDDEDLSLEKRIPCSHEVWMQHGSKAVAALGVDPAGARLATGSVDYCVSFWDFAGMDASLRSFRSLQPCENHPVRALQYSATGDCILVVSGSAQAKVLDRDGFETLECVKGDQYITDMAKTKGHTASLTSGCWHPHVRTEFLTASADGTMRLWRTDNPRQHQAVIKPRQQAGLKTTPTACAFSRDGNTVACACYDGSIQMWDHRKNYVNTSALLRGAHQKNTEVTCISYSYLGSYLSSRANDGTLKLWDLRKFKAPLAVFPDLHSRYDQTDCGFSPDDRMVFTPRSPTKPGEMGSLLFYDTNTFQKVTQIDVSEAHVIKAIWHAKLNQMFVGCGDGVVKCYYDPKRSLRGARLCVVKPHRKKQSVEVVSSQQIITPHALPLFRQEKLRTSKKKMERDRLDPVASKRPELPITAGRGGRVAASGSTLSSFVIRNLGLSKRVDDEQDPREAILKYAAAAEADPYWVAPAYKRTQPTPIFTDDAAPPPDKIQKTT